MTLQHQLLRPASRYFFSALQLYRAAFPAEEKVPLIWLLGRSLKAGVDFWAWHDGPAFVGLTFSVASRDLTYLIFLATSPSVRGQGFGSAILDRIAAQHAGRPLVLALEPQDQSAPNHRQRAARLRFYQRNGFSLQPFQVVDLGVAYDTMVRNGRFVPAQFDHLMRGYTGLAYPWYGSKIIAK
ncbi:GNAT family N-acetyltransferase [Lacticaseibacillus jixianensis]|uniref:GNAT family N-acetyltransferase n=1 Tax=Lacticaseibacillus jixianensis TaxID=2486012 RepID=A0ABW4B9M9_9LACO|nr:GNAT family N-acetyltransferase [Lacticaseibacillus jixianensis]